MTKKNKQKNPNLNLKPDKDLSNPYTELLQGPITNALSYVTDRNYTSLTEESRINKSTNQLEKTYKLKNESNIKNKQAQSVVQLELFPPALPEHITPNTRIVLDILTLFFAHGGRDRVFSFSVRQYQNLRGLKDYRTARRQLLKELNTISRIRLSHEHRNAYVDNVYNWALIADITVESGQVSISLGDHYAQHLAKLKTTTLPIELFQLNIKRFPYSYPIGRKLCIHRTMNEKKGNRDVISVKSLLHTYMSEKEINNIRSKEGQVSQRIVEPFNRNLGVLSMMIKDYRFYKKGGSSPIVGDDLSNMGLSFEEWLNLEIHIQWVDSFPAQTKKAKAVLTGKVN